MDQQLNRQYDNVVDMIRDVTGDDELVIELEQKIAEKQQLKEQALELSRTTRFTLEEILDVQRQLNVDDLTVEDILVLVKCTISQAIYGCISAKDSYTLYTLGFD